MDASSPPVAWQRKTSAGEALAVSWSDVDLEARTVEVDWKLIRIKGEGLRHVRRLKGGDDRTLPLPQFAVDLLRRRLAGPSGPEPVFPDTVGGWRDPSTTSRDLRTARGYGRLHLGHVPRVPKDVRDDLG